MINQEHLEQWITALLDGRYTQGQGYLTIIERGERKDCCLGVLADICPDTRQTHAENLVNAGQALYYDNSTLPLAPRSAAEWLGINTVHGERSVQIYCDVQTDDDPVRNYIVPQSPELAEWSGSLAEINDQGFTYAQIVDCIRYFGIKDRVTRFD